MRPTPWPTIVLLVPVLLGAAEAEPAAEADGAAVAVETATDPLVLDAEAAARLARANADRVLAAQAGRAATRAEARARLGALLPQVRADAGYTRYEESAPPVSGGDLVLEDNHDDYTAGLQVDQLLWSFGRVTGTLDAREALDRLAGSDERLAERDAAWRARNAVAAVQLAAARLEVARGRVGQRQSELEDAEDRFAVGAVPELDVREARIELITNRTAQGAAEAALERARHELATAVAVSGRPLAVAGDLERPSDLGLLLDAAEQNISAGPELEVLEAQADLSAAEHAIQRGRALPEFSAFGAWRSQGPEVDDQQDQWRVGLSVSWSLYDGGTTWALAEAARRDRLRLAHLGDAEVRERLRILADVRTDLDSLATRITEATEAVELAAENYADARERYREGVIDRVRLGDANLQITLARLRLIDLVYEEVLAAYQLMRLAE